MVSTTAGNLPADYVFHAVGPTYNNNPRAESSLHLAVTNCLKKANVLECKSIALPAISTGIFGYPKVTNWLACRNLMSNAECGLKRDYESHYWMVRETFKPRTTRHSHCEFWRRNGECVREEVRHLIWSIPIIMDHIIAAMYINWDNTKTSWELTENFEIFRYYLQLFDAVFDLEELTPIVRHQMNQCTL